MDAVAERIHLSGIAPHFHQDMDGEIPTDAGGHCKKAGDRRANIVDVRDHVGFPDRVVRVVVRQVAPALQIRERGAGLAVRTPLNPLAMSSA